MWMAALRLAHAQRFSTVMVSDADPSSFVQSPSKPQSLVSGMFFPVTLLWCLFSTDQLQDAKTRGSPRDGTGIKMALECGGLVGGLQSKQSDLSPAISVSVQ